MNPKNSNPKFTGERHIFHYTFLFDAYHVGTKTIETIRLTLRRLELTDAKMMFGNWTGDDKVTRFLRWDAHKTIDDTKNMIQQWVNNYQDDSTYYWGMYLKNGEMIGSIGITIISEFDFKGELGYKRG